MTRQAFQDCIDSLHLVIDQIKESAHLLHDSVNQFYDKVHPYGLHLDMVAEATCKYGHLVCASERDVLPLIFGAYYHDAIEDARFSYNDTKKQARLYMDDEQALMAAEIVYAMTNEKGRTRAERANDRYYAGIRQTPYGPFVKLADRLANTDYSVNHGNESNRHMKAVYIAELPHFLEAINPHSDDPRFGVPQEMVDHINRLLQ